MPKSSAYTPTEVLLMLTTLVGGVAAIELYYRLKAVRQQNSELAKAIDWQLTILQMIERNQARKDAESETEK